MTQEEFASRVTCAQGRMYRVARGYLHGEHDCLDAISEAITKAWQKRATLRNEGLFEPWLTRILIRECVNIQRAQRRVVPMEALPEEAEAPAQNEELRDALDSLSQKLRETVVLHYMEGYSEREIAWMLRLPRGTVSSRLHDARLALRKLLKEEIV